MKAEFRGNGENGVIVALTPESVEESLLLATWMRFDANAFNALVTRDKDKRIIEARIYASQAV